MRVDAKKVKELLGMRDMTIKDLADKLGVTSSNVYYMMGAEVYTKVAKDLMAELDVPIEAITTGSKEERYENGKV